MANESSSPFPLGGLAAFTAASTAGDILSSVIGNKLNFKYNRKLLDYQNQLANKQQVQSYRNQMEGLLGSGFNPAFGDANPASPSVPSATMDAKAPSLGQDLLQGFTMSQAAAQLKAQQLANIHQEQENESQLIDLQNKRSRYRYFNDPSFVNEDGSPMTVEEVEKYKKDHDGKLPPARVAASGAEGRFEGQASEDEFRTQLSERESRRSTAIASKNRADLDARIAKAQYDNPAVVDAFVKLPLAEYRKLREEANLFTKQAEKVGVDKAYQELVNERYESTSLVHFIGTIKDPQLSFMDKFIAAIAFLGQNLLDKVRIGM